MFQNFYLVANYFLPLKRDCRQFFFHLPNLWYISLILFLLNLFLQCLITDGERLVCVGWIESYVKSTEEREYLFDLDAGARGILAKYGRSDEIDLIFKSYSNLLRTLGN